MKILLSAYACEPNRGSEPGVGWNWAVELAKLGHEVWVLTRANNQGVIEQEFQAKQQPENLHFLYYDCPAWVRRLKKGNRGVHLYYLFWQWGAYKTAKLIHARERFDVVHHVTFVSVRQPSFMGNLGIPFIFGPVAGGEHAPWRLRYHYGVRGFSIDAVRDMLNLLVKIGPLMWRTFRQAQEIYVTSEQSKQLVPSRFHPKTQVQLAIGLDADKVSQSLTALKHKRFRVLYVGHFLYWKGMGLGIRAFAQFAKQVPEARLTMVGQGPDEKRWRQLAHKLNIAECIEWIPWQEQKKLSQIYRSHDVLLFPSLHDSGGMVVLEALAHGLPVVCLDLGGPGVIIDKFCGIKIATGGRTDKEVIEDLGTGLIKLAGDSALMQELRRGAVNTAKRYSWQGIVDKLYVQSMRPQ